jgi:ribose transport system substrate-binding protein
MSRFRSLITVGAAITISLLAACSTGGPTSPGTTPGTTAPGQTDAAPTTDSIGTIALSNSFIGNSWRKTMVADLELSKQQALDMGVIDDLKIVNANSDASEQISQIQALILEKPTVLLLDAASPTALNGVVQKACDAGIIVVSYDATVTADCAYRLSPDWVDAGYIMGKWMAEHLGGTGNVVLVRGVAGTDVDAGQYEGWLKALAEYPDIKVVGEVYGDWDDATAQSAIGGIMGTLPTDIAGVIANGGGYGIAQAFEAAGRATPTIMIGGRGTELDWWRKQRDANGYETAGWSNGPSIGQAAFWVGVNLAQGVAFPKDIPWPLLEINQDNLDSYADATELDSVAQQLWTNDMVLEQMASQ